MATDTSTQKIIVHIRHKHLISSSYELMVADTELLVGIVGIQRMYKLELEQGYEATAPHNDEQSLPGVHSHSLDQSNRR